MIDVVTRIIAWNITLEIVAIAVTLHGIYIRDYNRARYMKLIGVCNAVVGGMATLACVCVKYGFQIVGFAVFAGLLTGVLHMIFGAIVGVIGIVITRKGLG